MLKPGTGARMRHRAQLVPIASDGHPRVGLDSSSDKLADAQRKRVSVQPEKTSVGRDRVGRRAPRSVSTRPIAADRRGLICRADRGRSGRLGCVRIAAAVQQSVQFVPGVRVEIRSKATPAAVPLVVQANEQAEVEVRIGFA
jgi:hypothetical protein